MPCDDGVEQNRQLRKEETAITAKGVKRKRGQHECDVCGKMCARPSKLAEHMRTNTKEKPYECDVCEKRFSQSGNTTCVFTRTRNRMSAMCARRDIVILMVLNTTCVLNISSFIIGSTVYIHTYQHPEKVHQSLHLITEEEKIFFFFFFSSFYIVRF